MSAALRRTLRKPLEMPWGANRDLIPDPVDFAELQGLF